MITPRRIDSGDRWIERARRSTSPSTTDMQVYVGINPVHRVCESALSRHIGVVSIAQRGGNRPRLAATDGKTPEAPIRYSPPRCKNEFPAVCGPGYTVQRPAIERKLLCVTSVRGNQ